MARQRDRWTLYARIFGRLTSATPIFVASMDLTTLGPTLNRELSLKTLEERWKAGVAGGGVRRFK
jgi:hypothetical protein